MLLVSRFHPNPARTGELIAALWHGRAADVTVRAWIYLDSDPRGILLVWDAATEDDRAWLEQRLAPFGHLETWRGQDATSGMVAAVERDLDGFAGFLQAGGAPDAVVEAQLDLRRRGLAAETWDDALAAGRAWSAEQAARRSG